MQHHKERPMKTCLTRVMVIAILAILSCPAWALVSEYPFASILGTYNEISGGTVLGSNANDDESFNAIPLGFNFSFNGVQYTQISIQTDGFLAFGTSVLNSNLAISSATGTNNIVSAFNRDLMSRSDGELSYLLSGTAPNRVFTVQWKNYRRIPTLASGDIINFQIQLQETTNAVVFAYGSYTLTTISTAQTVQVGLRGDSNADFNNRSTTTNWSATVPGTAANASCLINATVYPSNGLSFVFAPQVPGPPLPAQIIAPANGAVDVALEANLTWSSGGGVHTGYKVFLGTDNPPTNLVNGVSQTAAVYDPPANFLYNTQYYWKIVPYNTFGDAVDCPVWSFTTLADPTVTNFPYAENFDTVVTPGIPLGWSVINANADAYTWVSVEDANANTAPNAMRIRYNSNLAMNDWLITPPLQLTTGSLYHIRFYYRAGSASYTEKLALYMGNAPTADALTTQLFINPNLNSTEYQVAEIELPVLAGGIKYLGFKGFSEMGMFQIYVDSFSIIEIGPAFEITPVTHAFGNVNIGESAAQSFTISNPGGGILAVNSIAVTGNPMFSLSNLPTLPASLGYGGSCSFSVVFMPTSAGDQAATVLINDNLARTEHAVPVTGTGFLMEAFNPPVNLTATVTGNDVLLAWSMPVPGTANLGSNSDHGVAGSRALLGYKVFRDAVQIGMIQDPGTLTYLDAGLDEGNYAYTVTAIYTSGESVPAGPVTATVNELLLAPGGLSADVVQNDVTLSWESPYPPINGSWLSWANDVLGNTVGTNEPVVFMVAQRWDQNDLAAYQGSSIVRMKFVPSYENCVYTAKIWSGGTATNPGTLVFSQIATNVVVNEWNQVLIPDGIPIPAAGDLWVGYEVNTQGGYPAAVDYGPAVEGKGNMMFFNGAWSTLSALSSTLVCNWLIGAYAAEGIGRKLPVPRPLEDLPITANNTGKLSSLPFPAVINRIPTRSLNGFKVYRDGVLVGNINDPSVLSWTDFNLQNGTYLYGVSAVYTLGESEHTEINVTVNEQLAPVLFADSFEAYPDFSIAFAPWTLIDLDQSDTYGISGVTFPGSGEPMAYMVFNPSATTPPMQNQAAYNGSKMLACFASTSPPNNDWLITPRIHLGTDSTLRFYAKSHTSTYGLEKFKIGVSTLAAVNPQGFQYVSGNNALEAPTTWTEYTYDLSGYDNQAVYIGIRCLSYDAFILYLDKFSVQCVGGNVQGEDEFLIPSVTGLKAVYPNPFSTDTQVAFTLEEKSFVSLEIYNVKGQKVKSLCNGEKTAGEHKLEWDGRDDHGKRLGSGIYFCRLQAGNHSSVHKLLLLK